MRCVYVRRLVGERSYERRAEKGLLLCWNVSEVGRIFLRGGVSLVDVRNVRVAFFFCR